MTTHTPAAAITRRSLTEAAYVAEARARFGADPRLWAFECPGCGDVATAASFPPGLGERAGAECARRYDAQPSCRRTANGVLPGPWLLRRDDGAVVGSFPFADALSGATTGAQTFDGTPGPAQPETAPAPPTAPPCAPSVERPTDTEPGPAADSRGPRDAWDYRAPLGEHQAVIGRRQPGARILVTYRDTDAPNDPWARGVYEVELPSGMTAAAWSIDALGRPFTAEDLQRAYELVLDAHAADIDAIPVTRWGFWHLEDGRLDLVAVVEGHYATANDAAWNLAPNERERWLSGPGTCEPLPTGRAELLSRWHELTDVERDAARHHTQPDVHGETTETEA